MVYFSHWWTDLQTKGLGVEKRKLKPTKPNSKKKTKQPHKTNKQTNQHKNQNQKMRQKKKKTTTPTGKKPQQTKALQQHLTMATQGQWGCALAQLLEVAPKQLPPIPVVTVARGSTLMKEIMYFLLPSIQFCILLVQVFCWTWDWGFLGGIFPTMWSNWECQVLVQCKFFLWQESNHSSQFFTFPNLPFVILIVKSFLRLAPDCHVPKAVFNSTLLPFVPFHCYTPAADAKATLVIKKAVFLPPKLRN